MLYIAHTNKRKKDDSTANSIYQRLLQHTQILAQLNYYIVSELPDYYHNKVYVMRYQKGILKLAVNEAILAAKLRYHVPEYIQRLRHYSDFKDLTDIQIKVVVMEAKTETTVAASNPPVMSEKTREHLQAVAKSITDEKLQKSLLNLATRTIPNK